MSGKIFEEELRRQPIPDHPLAGVIGGFADDPLWDEFQEAIAQYRRECDERYAAELDKEELT